MKRKIVSTSKDGAKRRKITQSYNQGYNISKYFIRSDSPPAKKIKKQETKHANQNSFYVDVCVGNEVIRPTQKETGTRVVYLEHLDPQYKPSDYGDDENSYTNFIVEVENSHATDDEYSCFIKGGIWNFSKVEEVEGELFSFSSTDYSLVYCVTEDMKVWKGIHFTFKEKFKNIKHLLYQGQKTGGLAVLKDNSSERFFYHLVIKQHIDNKVDASDVWKSLEKLRTHVTEHNIKFLAIPKIFCRRSELEWCSVKSMLEFLFREVDVHIVACNGVEGTDEVQQQNCDTIGIRNLLKSVDSPDKQHSIVSNPQLNYSVVKEVRHDISSMPSHYSLVYWVCEDMRGPFENQFDNTQELLGQHQRAGGLAVFKDTINKRYVYYLVIKKHAKDKIKYRDLCNSLKLLQAHLVKHKIINIIMAKLDSKEDGIEWQNLKPIIELIFRPNKIRIFVCDSKRYEEMKRRSEGCKTKFNESLGEDSSEDDFDEEYLLFKQQPLIWECNKITEIEKDLFLMPTNVSLAHSVSQDMGMSKGIGSSFKKIFGGVSYLQNQCQKAGGLAVLQNKSRYIYYLVTKENSWSQTKMEDLWKSLKRMRSHILEHNVKYLAIPKIGSGLDRLPWYKVKTMIAFIFRKVNITISVCTFKENSNSIHDTSFSSENDCRDFEYLAFQQRAIWDFSKTMEIEKDLFRMPPCFSLAHCVAEDMRMGKGIALLFKTKFSSVSYLLNQNQKPGGLATLRDSMNGRFIYYLVTKKHSRGKPEIRDFWKSLVKMRDHIKQNRVEHLAIPRLGCGLDGLPWPTVRSMVEFLFKDVNIHITVCNFNGPDLSTRRRTI